MASSKQFHLEGIGPITVHKRRSSRSMRLSIAADGSLRVSIPLWTSFAAATSFAHTQRDWILANRPAPTAPLRHGQKIGKAHRLVMRAAENIDTVSATLSGTEIVVTYPATLLSSDPLVQKKATAACIRALRKQGQKLLPQRLEELSKKHNLPYTSVSIKRLKTRWGSCDQHKNIVLNLYLMMLPWECIDYVLLHELTHTKLMQHGKPFWEEMKRLDPTSPQHRKAMKAYHPMLAGDQDPVIL